MPSIVPLMIANLPCFKIVAAGDTSVGKSSIIKRLISGAFQEDACPTTGADFFTWVCPIDSETIRLQIWDTAGQERFHSISKSYFRSAVGAILVYDITSTQSFDALMDWLPDLQSLALPNAYILLIGNKADLEAERTIAPGAVKDFAQLHGLEAVETSALNGKGVIEAFTRLAFEIHARSKANAVVRSPMLGPVPQITLQEKQKKDCC
jgi:small GTP-binding protein